MKLKQILNDDVNVLTEFCVKIVLHFQATILVLKAASYNVTVMVR